MVVTIINLKSLIYVYRSTVLAGLAWVEIDTVQSLRELVDEALSIRAVLLPQVSTTTNYSRQSFVLDGMSWEGG